MQGQPDRPVASEVKRNADDVTALSNVNCKDIGKRLARVGTDTGGNRETSRITDSPLGKKNPELAGKHRQFYGTAAIGAVPQVLKIANRSATGRLKRQKG